MQAHEIARPNRISANSQAGDTLHVVALHDGLISCVYAQEALAALALAVRPEMKMINSVWSFDMLTRLDMRHASHDKCAEADILLIAATAAAPLPAHVKSWINASLRDSHKGAPTLIALYEEDFEQIGLVAPLRSDLAAIAAQWRTPLLCNAELDSRLEQGLMAEFTGGRAPVKSHFNLSHLLANSEAGRWGINE